MISFSSYGNYASSNYGVNTMVFTFGDLNVYFSYKTIVAFSHPSTGLVVSQNEWSTTTGKHLNWIDGGEKSERVPHSELMERLNKIKES